LSTYAGWLNWNMSSCTGCVNTTSANWTAVDPTQPMTSVSCFVVAGIGRPETWRVSLIQQADATQPALIRLIGENGRYLARSNFQTEVQVGSADFPSILLSVDELVATDQSIWQVANAFVEGSALDLIAPTNSTSVGCYISNSADLSMDLWNVMAAHCNSSSNTTFSSPYFSVKRVPESVLLVNPLLNGYDTVHLPFLQNQTVQIDAVFPPHEVGSLNIETKASCVGDGSDGSTFSASPITTAHSDDPNFGVGWMVNFVGDPSAGLVQFTTADNYSLSYIAVNNLSDEETLNGTGLIGAEYASNSTRTLWQLKPAPPTNGQPSWILQPYDLIQAGITNQSMGYCGDCAYTDLCGDGKANQTAVMFWSTIVSGPKIASNNLAYFQFILL